RIGYGAHGRRAVFADAAALHVVGAPPRRGGIEASHHRRAVVRMDEHEGVTRQRHALVGGVAREAEDGAVHPCKAPPAVDVALPVVRPLGDGAEEGDPLGRGHRMRSRQGSMSPTRRAYLVRPATSRMPSRSMMAARWFDTVFSLMPSSEAISLVLLPRATRSRICRCRALKGSLETGSAMERCNRL